MYQDYHSKGVYWQKPLLKKQLLGKYWNTFVGNRSGIYSCKYSHKNLSIWVKLPGSGYASLRNSDSVYYICTYTQYKGQSMNWKQLAHCAAHYFRLIFWHRHYTGWWRASFFFLQRLFLKCISLPVGSPLPPSSSHTPLSHVLWFLLQALGSLHFTLPFHDRAERGEKCKARDPSCRKSTGVRWEQSTLSRTALVGQWWGLSNRTTLSPSSPSPCCLCPQYGSRKNL